ncbi:MAG: hypothetical protein Q9199_004867 [Rusavskia elegans]
MKNDVAFNSPAVARLVEQQEQYFLLVAHFADAFLGSRVDEGLSVKERKERGDQRGVEKLSLLLGRCGRRGFKGNAIYCANPANLLFNDLPSTSASSWVAKLQCQPSSGWDDVVDYVGWKNVPSAYLICEQDAVLHPEMQKQMAERAGSEIEKCNAGHYRMIGRPEWMVEAVEMAAGECAGGVRMVRFCGLMIDQD